MEYLISRSLDNFGPIVNKINDCGPKISQRLKVGNLHFALCYKVFF